MRRLWAAAILFAAVIGLALWGLAVTAGTAEDMMAQVARIETAVEQEDYPAAARLAGETASQWEARSRVLCGFLSHTDLDTADQALDALRVSLRCEDRRAALERCAQLRGFWDRMRKADLPLPENIL